MRQKIGTSIKKPLLMQAKLMAFRKNKQLNEIIEEALEKYLKSENLENKRSAVKATRGVIPASPHLVRQIMEEDPYFDS